MTPFTATNKILGPYLFSKTCRETLNEKIEYYFHEPAFMPLFIQVRLTKVIRHRTLTSTVIAGKLRKNDPRQCRDNQGS